MGKTSSPRHGSLQFWPRVRASRPYPRIRMQLDGKGVIGFAGYKAGMTHITTIDNRKTSPTKGEELFIPATVIECPPLKVIGVKLYKIAEYALRVFAEASLKSDKQLARKNKLPKDHSNLEVLEKEISNAKIVRLVVSTQPNRIGMKKTPEIFEIDIRGKISEQWEYAKTVFGKEIAVGDAIKEGMQVDVHAVSKGKGYQGPVKRFGVALRSHKSEKGQRGPANLGAWHGARQWTVAKAGQMGYHSRMERNKWVLKISSDAKEINPAGGFIRYGKIKENYILLKGSIPGSSKRLVRIVPSRKVSKKMPEQAPTIEAISIQSKQGV